MPEKNLPSKEFLTNQFDDEKLKKEIKSYYLDKNGNKIIITEKTKEHLLAHPDIIPYLEEAIQKADINTDDRFHVEIKLDKIIGKEYCVQTKPLRGNSRALFAHRKNRLGPTRVVYGKGYDCDTITLFGAKSKYNAQEYVLFTAYIGHKADMEPWDINIKDGETMKNSYDFWRTHALVYDPDDPNASFTEEPQEKTWEQVMQEMQPIYKKLDEEKIKNTPVK